ncbi:hypothetical protein [Cetobacterium sp.]|uniref:hypothetical protein n=1 Tax=Cetobacterium sp. TaxID=2071632 RepID=UPI003F34C92C
MVFEEIMKNLKNNKLTLKEMLELRDAIDDKIKNTTTSGITSKSFTPSPQVCRCCGKKL